MLIFGCIYISVIADLMHRVRNFQYISNFESTDFIKHVRFGAEDKKCIKSVFLALEEIKHE